MANVEWEARKVTTWRNLHTVSLIFYVNMQFLDTFTRQLKSFWLNWVASSFTNLTSCRMKKISGELKSSSTDTERFILLTKLLFTGCSGKIEVQTSSNIAPDFSLLTQIGFCASSSPARKTREKHLERRSLSAPNTRRSTHRITWWWILHSLFFPRDYLLLCCYCFLKSFQFITYLESLLFSFRCLPAISSTHDWARNSFTITQHERRERKINFAFTARYRNFKRETKQTWSLISNWRRFISNLSWAGKSLTSPQHSQLALSRERKFLSHSASVLHKQTFKHDAKKFPHHKLWFAQWILMLCKRDRSHFFRHTFWRSLNNCEMKRRLEVVRFVELKIVFLFCLFFCFQINSYIIDALRIARRQRPETCESLPCVRHFFWTKIFLTGSVCLCCRFAISWITITTGKSQKKRPFYFALCFGITRWFIARVWVLIHYSSRISQTFPS